MTKISIIIFFLLSINLLSQSNKSITGAMAGWVDTLSTDRAKEASNLNKGLVDKPVNPKLYIVGPGDEFSVTIQQYEPIELNVTISPDSKIYIPKIGLIDAKNKTLNEVYDLIKKEIQNVFNTDNIYVVLSKVKQFKVRLSGNVPKSMTIAAYSTDRVSEVLDKSGALNSNSSIRNIKLVRAETKEIVRVDLAKYFVTLNEELNPYVRGGDNIIIPEVSNDVTIHISGEIPVKDQDYEYVENDSLSTLIRLAQGFLKSSFLDSVEFIRFNENTLEYDTKILNLNNWDGKIYDFNLVLENDFELSPGDRVYVRKNPNWVKNTYIKIDGQVKFPGKYPIKSNETRIADIIKSAGGFTENAAPELAEYIRQEEADLPDFELERLRKLNMADMSESENRYFQARIREKKGLMSVDLANATINTNSVDNILVENRDSLFIPKKKNYIIVQGRVNSPGAIIYNENMTYLDYVALSGGFGFRADQNETFITKPGGQQFLASDMNYKLEPGDVILVPPEKERDLWPLFLETFTLITQIVTVASVIITLSNSTK